MTKREFRNWEKRHNLACCLVEQLKPKLEATKARSYLDELILYGNLLTPQRTEDIIKELESL